MTGRALEVSTYYQILFELLIFVAFVIVLKIVMLLLMAKLSIVLSDDPQKTKQEHEARKARSTFDQMPGQKWLRLGLGLLVTLSGLSQIQPRLVSLPPVTLREDFGFQFTPGLTHGMVSGFANLWAAHSTWMNVTSVGAQLLVGLILLTTANALTVRITSAVGGLIALFDFVVMTGFGGLLRPAGTVLGDSSVRGLVYLLMFLLVFIPTGKWKKGTVNRIIELGIATYWLLGVILQALPGEGFWHGTGWNQILQVNGDALVPGWVASMSHGLAPVFVSLPAVWNTIFIVLMLIWAGGSFVGDRLGRTGVTVQVASLVFIFACWIVFGHTGFETVYLFPMDAGPAVGLATLLILRSKTRGKVASHSSVATGANARA